ncbi:MAG: hypothetical protein L6Q95_09980 [Planctomycetes bacterium]|nr:hypothetical protein [Planctomycetota bacterium]
MSSFLERSAGGEWRASQARKRRLTWLVACASVLIALSWFDVVSHAVGWCGFAIGMAGSVIGWGFRPPQADSRGERPPE